jgi:hypothetical protein
MSSPAGRPVTGFVVVGETPIVAIDKRLSVFKAGEPFEIRVDSEIDGIAIGSDDRLVVQSGTDLRVADDSGLAPLVSALQGRVVGTGDVPLLQVLTKDDAAELYVIGTDSPPFPLARFVAPLRAVSWGPLGLAVIVGEELLVWKPGASKIDVLLRDGSLTAANDVCLVGDRRAVVSMKSATVLVSQQTASVVFGFASRCAYRNGAVYLLEERTGFIWRLAGLSTLGDPVADREHGLKLLSDAVPGSPISDLTYGEAVRLLGCIDASSLAASRSLRVVSGLAPGRGR